MKENHALQGHLLGVFTILIWGITFVSSKVLLRTFTPLEIMIARFAMGFLALLIAGRGWLRPQKRSHELLFALAGLTGVSLYFLLENIALTYMSACLVGIIVAAAPLFTAIFSALFLRERLNHWFFLGFLCAMAGVSLVSFAGVTEFHFSPIGALIGVCAALVWGVYSVLIRKLSLFGYATIPLTCRIFAYGVLFLLVPVFLEGFPTPLEAWTQPVHIANLIFLGLGASAICFVTWNRTVYLLGPVRACVYIYASPVVTIICSAIVLHERMTPTTWLGTALALTGLVLCERKDKPVGDTQPADEVQ